MNKGKICVSVCAKTADELIEQIKRAEALADVIEIRFDCLDEGEHNQFLQQFDHTKSPKIFLITFRPKEQGGKKDLSFEKRNEFWTDSRVYEFSHWSDIELDFPAEIVRDMWGLNSFAEKSSNPTTILKKFQTI